MCFYMIIEESRKEPAEDLYAGYYWGNHPYESYKMPGRKSDEELKNSILERLRKNNTKINSTSINITVLNSAVTVNGFVKTYEERRLVSWEVWNVPGVAKVLNELQVIEPETCGPSKKYSEERKRGSE
jgi:osmotically-inducible protein OsmY